jgi:hypothetical protein
VTTRAPSEVSSSILLLPFVHWVLAQKTGILGTINLRGHYAIRFKMDAALKISSRYPQAYRGI